MSCGVRYKFEGRIPDVFTHQLNNEIDTNQKIIDMYWREIIAYAAMTPPANAKDIEGNEYPWAEFIATKINSIREGMEECYHDKQRMEDCRDTLEENPENVKDY